MKRSQKVINFTNNLPNNYLKSEFSKQNLRVPQLTKSASGISIDFSKQKWNPEIVVELIKDLTDSAKLPQKIASLFAGEKINYSEDRAVKHYLLRAPRESFNDPELDEVIEERERFLGFAQLIYENKDIDYIVNIGIGGSDLGPLMASQALAGSKKQTFFVSNVDPADLAGVMQKIDLARTIFVVVSKTFTTQETLLNAESARESVINELGASAVDKHFVAVSTNIEQCLEFGISEDKIFSFWDWVGGRYSLASSVGISLAMSHGREVFSQLLAGMHDFDEHFRTADPLENLAIWHATSYIYNINYLNMSALAVIPYSSQLKEFPAFLQQLIMESNGKSVNIDNKFVDYKTSPVIFGEPGTNSQHSFFQSLHQGTSAIAVDFIVIKPNPLVAAEISLVANALAQAAVLAFGNEEISDLPFEKHMPADRPSNLIILEKLDAYHLGALIALYEASTIVQGFCWQINSFDQWGVQLGKTVANQIENAIKNNNFENIDESTKAAIKLLFNR